MRAVPDRIAQLPDLPAANTKQPGPAPVYLLIFTSSFSAHAWTRFLNVTLVVRLLNTAFPQQNVDNVIYKPGKLTCVQTA